MFDQLDSLELEWQVLDQSAIQELKEWVLDQFATLELKEVAYLEMKQWVQVQTEIFDANPVISLFHTEGSVCSPLE